mmetsp:Transcript_108369/g.317058  ORF Transcript_108369/g.317058 Transcript_108369/m.317058 type:complete len:217 (-) Transcript_108369:87-737(-)
MNMLSIMYGIYGILSVIVAGSRDEVGSRYDGVLTPDSDSDVPDMGQCLKKEFIVNVRDRDDSFRIFLRQLMAPHTTFNNIRNDVLRSNTKEHQWVYLRGQLRRLTRFEEELGGPISDSDFARVLKRSALEELWTALKGLELVQYEVDFQSRTSVFIWALFKKVTNSWVPWRVKAMFSLKENTGDVERAVWNIEWKRTSYHSLPLLFGKKGRHWTAC